MEIRKAQPDDIPQILALLAQVDLIHHKGRPDLFKIGTKYTRAELNALLADECRPILVAADGSAVRGYAFCILQAQKEDNILPEMKTLYLDDLCVDEKCRGMHIGSALYRAVVELAKQAGCYHVTLNAWCLNPGAIRFYEALGMKPMKICMEQVL